MKSIYHKGINPQGQREQKQENNNEILEAGKKIGEL